MYCAADEKPEKRHLFWPIIIIILLIMMYVFYTKYTVQSPQVSAPIQAETILHIQPIQPQDISLEKKYIGYVTPIHEVELQPYINGFLDRIDVSGGQEVKAGEMMLRIEQAEYQARLAQTKAQIIKAKADFMNTQVYYRRVKSAGTQAVSKTELDNARTKYLMAQAALIQAQAQYDLAKVNYDYTEIHAPINGIVGDVDLSVGDYVSPAGKALIRIIQYNPIRVVFSIPDKDYLEEMKKPEPFVTDKIKLRLADGKIYQAQGTYRYSDNQLNRQTNSIAIFADFPNPYKALVANAYVDVMVEKAYNNIVLLPKKLVNLEEKGNFIYVVNGKKLQKSRVRILGEKGSNYVLENNFRPNDFLVMDKVTPQIITAKIKLEILNQKSLREKA